jgi:hypothetical protein
MYAPRPIDEVHELNFAYRRYSNDIYAAALTDLLEAHDIPYDVVAEPEGAGAVLLGSVAIPGVMVMIRESDAARVQYIEQEISPQAQTKNPAHDKEQEVAGGWLFMGYLFALGGAPLAIIAGLHLFTAKRRGADLIAHYAYDASARRHGRYIFWFALCILLFSMFRMMTGARMTFLDTFSFLIWQLDRAL